MYLLRLSVKRVISILRGWLLGRFATGIVYQAGEHRFVLPASDYSIGRHLGRRGEYQPEELAQLFRICEENEISSVCFVGSHVGYFAVKIHAAVDQVFAIEANPATREWLELNIALNHCTNVEVIPFAMSDRDHMVEFWPALENTGGSKIALKFEPAEAIHDKGEPISVEARRLDSFNLSAELFVIDVEGHELPTLKGMEKSLASAKVVACEIIPALIEAAGFTVREEIDLLGANFDRFYIDTLDSEAYTSSGLLDFFLRLQGDQRWVSRNVICYRHR